MSRAGRLPRFLPRGSGTARQILLGQGLVGPLASSGWDQARRPRLEIRRAQVKRPRWQSQRRDAGDKSQEGAGEQSAGACAVETQQRRRTRFEAAADCPRNYRSEERRVGKGGRSRWTTGGGEGELDVT